VHTTFLAAIGRLVLDKIWTIIEVLVLSEQRESTQPAVRCFHPRQARGEGSAAVLRGDRCASMARCAALLPNLQRAVQPRGGVLRAAHVRRFSLRSARPTKIGACGVGTPQATAYSPSRYRNFLHYGSPQVETAYRQSNKLRPVVCGAGGLGVAAQGHRPRFAALARLATCMMT
jgi:hypothetical protein